MSHLATNAAESIALLVAVVGTSAWMTTWSAVALKKGVIVLSAALAGYLVAATHGFTRPGTMSGHERRIELAVPSPARP